MGDLPLVPGIETFRGKIRFEPLTEAEAREALGWRYPPPYDFYNPRGPVTAEQVAGLMAPESPQWSVQFGDDELIGVIGIGVESQVPGGDYSEPAIDIGIHLRPERCGQGLGRQVVAAFIDFLETLYGPSTYRATIAAFNERSLKTFQSLGFTESSRFRTAGAEMRVGWAVLTRTSKSTCRNC